MVRVPTTPDDATVDPKEQLLPGGVLAGIGGFLFFMAVFGMYMTLRAEKGDLLGRSEDEDDTEA